MGEAQRGPPLARPRAGGETTPSVVPSVAIKPHAEQPNPTQPNPTQQPTQPKKHDSEVGPSRSGFPLAAERPLYSELVNTVHGHATTHATQRGQRFSRAGRRGCSGKPAPE